MQEFAEWLMHFAVPAIIAFLKFALKWQLAMIKVGLEYFFACWYAVAAIFISLVFEVLPDSVHSNLLALYADIRPILNQLDSVFPLHEAFALMQMYASYAVGIGVLSWLRGR